jgi:peptide/nickel transport system ATP-binding protein
LTNLLDLRNVTVEYSVGKAKVTALDHVTLSVPSEGYTLGIVGESGSGKTTLGMSILDLIESPGEIISGSEVFYKGNNVLEMSKHALRKYRWEEVSMIYQAAMNSLNPVKKIHDPIVEVLREHRGLKKREAKEIAKDLLSDVGIKPSRLEAYPHELSGGMRQRVVIALALALSPKLVIADEPTSALDVVVQRQIIGYLKKEIKERKLSLIYITHEISLLPDLVDNVAVFHKGKMVECGPIQKVLNDPSDPYTKKLLSSVLEIDTPLEGVLSKVMTS